MYSRDLVSVTIVTYNSGRFIRRCLESLLDQKYPKLEVIIIDNASTDGTADILESFEDRCLVIYNDENLGFAAAQNQAIGLSNGNWVLTLNPDVFLLPGFIEALIEGGRLDPRAGTVCGKLFTISAGFDIPDKPVVDSTGIYFTPMLRHFDRGSQECDNGHYLRYEYVFGATAAAACYRREMIEDVSINGEFFDPDFFSYREDADLAWRAQLLGWKCIYVPYARAYHVRKLRPGMRRSVSPEINMHSVKNRFLMRLKNITPRLYLRHLLPITMRDLGIIAYCLLSEQSSIKAFFITAQKLPKVLEKRRWIQARRRVDDAYIEQWFRSVPVSLPVEGYAEPAEPKVSALHG
ncbi:MAG TPA: glycosyltransferase family 2 protein [Bryobacterales bacterium]|nr:glycosyltransferase family 2 protein [Bryobacterales bacterium]